MFVISVSGMELYVRYLCKWIVLQGCYLCKWIVLRGFYLCKSYMFVTYASGWDCMVVPPWVDGIAWLLSPWLDGIAWLFFHEWMGLHGYTSISWWYCMVVTSVSEYYYKVVTSVSGWYCMYPLAHSSHFSPAMPKQCVQFIQHANIANRRYIL